MGLKCGCRLALSFVTSSLLFLEPYRLLTSSITSSSPTTLLCFLNRCFLDDDVHSIQSPSPSLCKRTPSSSVECRTSPLEARPNPLPTLSRAIGLNMDSSPTDPAVDRERERAVEVPSLAGGGSSRPEGVTDGREGEEDTDEHPPQATTANRDDPASPPATVAGEGGEDGRAGARADETPSTRTASDGAAAAEMDPPSTTSPTSLTQSLNEFERRPLESGIAIWSGGRLLALIDPTSSSAAPPEATPPPSTSALPSPEPPRPSRDEVFEAMSLIARSAEISERASSEFDALAQSFRSAVQAVSSASRNVVDERARLLDNLLVEVWDATEQVLAGEGRSGGEALGRIADAVRGTSEVRVLSPNQPPVVRVLTPLLFGSAGFSTGSNIRDFSSTPRGHPPTRTVRCHASDRFYLEPVQSTARPWLSTSRCRSSLATRNGRVALSSLQHVVALQHERRFRSCSDHLVHPKAGEGGTRRTSSDRRRTTSWIPSSRARSPLLSGLIVDRHRSGGSSRPVEHSGCDSDERALDNADPHDQPSVEQGSTRVGRGPAETQDRGSWSLRRGSEAAERGGLGDLVRETIIGASDQPKVRSCDSFASLSFDQAQPDRRRWMLRHHLHLCHPSGSIFRRCQVEPPNFCHGQVRKPLACQLPDSSSYSIRWSTQAAANGAFHVDARSWRSRFHLRDRLGEHQEGGQQPYQSCHVKTRLL